MALLRDAFHRDILVSSAIIVGSVLVFAVLFYALTSDILRHSREVSENRIAAESSVKATETLAAVKQNLPTIQRYETIMHRLLPDQFKLLDLPRTLDATARVEQVVIQFIPGGQTDPEKERAGTIPFSIEVSGPLQGILAFMKDIESRSQQFLLSLDGFELKRTDEANYGISATGKAFFKK